MDINWPAWIQAIAAAVVAVFTVVLWWATKRYADAADKQARASAEMIAAALDQAKASRSQADAAEAMLAHAREERELDWRPYVLSTYRFGAPYVRNLGRGPALNCHALLLRQSQEGPWQWVISHRVDLAPLGDDSVSWSDTLVGTTEPNFERVRDGTRMAVVCQDQFGWRYWFEPSAGAVETWTGAEQHPPSWSQLATRAFEVH